VESVPDVKFVSEDMTERKLQCLLRTPEMRQRLSARPFSDTKALQRDPKYCWTATVMLHGELRRGGRALASRESCDKADPKSSGAAGYLWIAVSLRRGPIKVTVTHPLRTLVSKSYKDRNREWQPSPESEPTEMRRAEATSTAKPP
jgi:hypothetical protein